MRRIFHRGGWFGRIGALAASVSLSLVVSARAQQRSPAGGTAERAAPDPGEFFQRRVLPVLAENCFACHGQQLQMAGLRLDSREGMLEGRAGGQAAIIPGDPDKSALIQAVRYTEKVRMPPTRKLNDEDIEALALWVKMGAPWPGEAEGKLPQVDMVGTERPEGIPPELAELFEKHIRPVLAEKCYTCHTDTASGGLRLDSRESLLKGGARGPAIVVGEPDESLLVRAVSHADPSLKMPLVGDKLRAEQIENLKKWIRLGAPWVPASPGRVVRVAGSAGLPKHWAFRPVQPGAPPAVKDKAWVKTPVDVFVLARLEEKGLVPSKTADRRTLLRRVYHDLIGLPPTRGDVEAFKADHSPDAFAKVVDRLLGSKYFGERWARHWLDLARYGETRGYTTVGVPEELRYPFAYTYRDWVIRAFNEDMPYDQFLTYQIAADFLASQDDKRGVAAMGFLTLGRRFANNVHEIIDDRLDVIFRATQALTVACARCHDHKYDPIPTKDYYSLYGVLAGTEEKTLPLYAAHEDRQPYVAYEAELKKRQQRIREFLEAKRNELLPRFRRRVGDYLLAAHQAQMLRTPDKAGELDLVMVERWRAYVEESRKRVHPVWGPWHQFTAVPEAEFAHQAVELTQRFATGGDPAKPLNPHVARLFAQGPPASLSELAARYGALFSEFYERKEKGLLPSPNLADEQLCEILYGERSPTNIPVEHAPPEKQGIDVFLDEPSKDRLNALKLSMLRWSLARAAPPHALALVDLAAQKNPRVFIRGKPDNLGDEVPRQFLSVVAGPGRQPFGQGSGRLELARAIASKDNPLTARVMVNRVWLHLLGSGLVRTPSDFGLRSEPPTHPELLDHLAHRFMEEGWSIKKLIRGIVLSSVYQQSSDNNPANGLIDPENRLLWRMNRRRLDFEALRDSLLFVSGRLDTTMGGPSDDLTAQPFSRRRSVYGFIDRDNLPSMFRAFDFAPPESHSPQRTITTVPQQALFLMNSPFVIEQARELALRAEREGKADPGVRAQFLYDALFQRAPAPEEKMLAARFVQSTAGRDSKTPVSAPRIWQYGYGGYDESTGRLKDFRPLPHWTGESWQGGPDLPDPILARTMLKAEEGHPGPDAEHAVIRRWVAPGDGVIMIVGTLTQPPLFSTAAIAGDGVRARIVSNRWGELGSWTVHNGFEETNIGRVEVKRGDAIDFVVDCRSNPQYDSFAWAPTLRQVSSSAGRGAANGNGDVASNAGEMAGEWSASNDFAGPPEPAPRPLEGWEKYAQVLLMTNEFLFVD